jgi:tRNA threonylcarbamoyladenosine modification (KEOPS) complex  Pcc1 subunit
MKNIRKKGMGAAFFTALAVTVFCFVSPVYGQATRSPIDVNLIIDGSSAFSDAKDEITAWVCNRLDQILINGDRVTVWNAGSSARVIYSGSISGDSEKEAVKKSIREFQASGNNADFSGALRDASGRQSSTFSYTLLISASQNALSSVLTSPQANLLRFSRIEEFSTWRALVVGLNLDSRVRSAASAWMGS